MNTTAAAHIDRRERNAGIDIGINKLLAKAVNEATEGNAPMRF